MSSLAPRPKFPSATFKNAGDSITGTVAFEPSEIQAMKYNTKIPMDPWPDGSPKMKVIVTLNTSEGTMNLWLGPGRMQTAVRKAIQESGARDIAVGGKLTFTYTGRDPEGQNPDNLPKMYEASYTPPGGAAADDEPPW